MNRTTAVITTILALLLAVPRDATADPIDDATAVVLDPNARPVDKLAAMKRLERAGIDARRAVPALVGQMDRGPKEVRDAALATLYHVAGPSETMRQVHAFPPDFDLDDELRRRVLESVTGWRFADTLKTVLASNGPYAPRVALDVAHELARTDPAGLKALPDAKRTDLIRSLNELDKTDPSARTLLVDLVEQLGPTSGGEAAQLLLRVAADDGRHSDADLRERAGRLLAAALEPKSRTSGAIAAVAAGLVDPDSKVAAIARTMVPKDAPDAFKPAVADAVAGRIAGGGDPDAVALLKRYDVDAATFTQAVQRRMGFANDAQRLLLVRALLRADVAPGAVVALPGLRWQVTHALGRPAELAEEVAVARRRAQEGLAAIVPDAAAVETADALTAAATELLAAPAVRGDAARVLAGAVDQGLKLAPSTIHAFEVDRGELARQLLSRLAVGKPEVQLSAARMLAVVGVPDDPGQTRAALGRLLRSSDPALRSAAAEALGTPAARDLARVPELLRDLSAEAPGARRVAARQIQSLAVDAPPEITALLVRATDAWDMATREGLRLALEGSFATARPPKEVPTTLAASSNPDATTRAYARAALRQLPP